MQRFNNMSISRKRAFCFLVIGIVPMIAITVISVTSDTSTITTQITDTLRSTLQLKGHAVKRYIDANHQRIELLARAPYALEAATKFTNSFSSIATDNGFKAGSDRYNQLKKSIQSYYATDFANEYKNRTGSTVDAAALIDLLPSRAVMAQSLYISENKNALGEKHLMGQARKNYLVGPDNFMRSDAHIDPDNHSVFQSFLSGEASKVCSEGIDTALSGQSGSGTYQAYMDQSDEMKTEAEIDTIITAASQGDCSKTIDIDRKSGFFLSLSNDLNALSTTTQSALQELSNAIQSLSEGKLNYRINNEYSGPFHQLKTALNSTFERLSSIIEQINSSSNSAQSSTGEMQHGMDELSRRTESQSAAIGQATAKMHQIATAVKESAEQTQSARQLANNSQEKADAGGKIVEETITVMHSINKSSTKISEIIGMIAEIALQTNLLALNAAVEAAQAGEQGRAFAVVAGEVRQLAQRSADAAREIKALISDSAQRISHGVGLVNEAGSTLDVIVKTIADMNTMIVNIADNTTQQGDIIVQVNQAVDNMEESIQHNAALVEESTAVSTNMTVEVNNMVQAIAFFR